MGRKFGWHSGVAITKGVKSDSKVIPNKIWIPANQLSLQTSGTAATAGQVDDLYCLLFDASSTEDCNYGLVLPNWPTNTLKVRAYIYWSSANTSANKAAVWDIDYGAFAEGEDIDMSSPTNVTVTDTDDTTANALNVTPALEMTASPGELLVMHIYRDADETADTLTVDAALRGILVEIEEA